MPNTLRLRCTFCSKSVSTEVQDRTIVRAILVCPECLELGRIVIMDFNFNQNESEEIVIKRGQEV